MEIFDIVDAFGQPTGQTVERTRAHALGIPHRTAHVWVVRELAGKHQVLLQMRALNKDSFPGKWDTSSAGHIRAGDEPLNSAIRELEEELGIRARPEALKYAGTFRIQYEKEFYGKMFRDNEFAFVYVYDGPVALSRLQLQAEEVAAADWFDLDAVSEALKRRDPAFCVPRPGFAVLQEYLGK